MANSFESSNSFKLSFACEVTSTIFNYIEYQKSIATVNDKFSLEAANHSTTFTTTKIPLEIGILYEKLHSSTNDTCKFYNGKTRNL